jgi:integrase/recombinase XerD
MSTMSDRAERYLTLRRALGYSLGQQGQMLMQFIAYLDAHDADHITIAEAVRWAGQPHDSSPSWGAARLSIVRTFARYVHVLDPGNQVPPDGLFPDPGHRAVPYIYSSDEVAALTATAGCLRPTFRALTYQCLIGLLAVTGLRRAEAIGLDDADLDAVANVVTIRSAKFSNVRQIPLHPTAMTALGDYQTVRDAAFPDHACRSLFLSTRATRLIGDNTSHVFAGLVRAANLDTAGRIRPPRLHDLRHTFAVNTMIGWYRTGANVDAMLPLLSTYLGHTSPASTYWYLTGTPELLALVADKVDAQGGHS